MTSLKVYRLISYFFQINRKCIQAVDLFNTGYFYIFQPDILKNEAISSDLTKKNDES